MADFRRIFLAFAVLALIAIPAFGQSTPLVCGTQGNVAAVPTLLRAEGLTEQVGDLVINCQGGTPTAAGNPYPQVNIQVFLSTPITSRLTTSNGLWSEALLLVDEPVAGAGTTSNPGFSVCGNLGGCSTTSTAAGNGATAAGSGPYSPTNGGFNVFQGQPVPGNPGSIAFLGVPFAPPGTTGRTLTFRITNIRTAPGAPSSSLVPVPVVEYVSITGSTSIPVNNPQQIVGYTLYGLDQSNVLVNSAQNFSICTGQNATSNGGLSTSASGAQFYLAASEGFASAFKVRNISVANTGNPAAAPLPQDVPGSIYNTETGFYMGSDTPGSAGNGISAAGLATQGTRLMFTLNNPQTGATVYVPTVVPLFQRGSTQTVTGYAVLVSGTDANGAGSFAPNTGSTVSANAAQLGAAFAGGAAVYTPVGSNYPAGCTTGSSGCVSGSLPASAPAAALVAVPSSGNVVYEVAQTNSSAFETVAVPVVVSFGGFAPGPVTGAQATATVTFAPVSSETGGPLGTARASYTLPVPRFTRTPGTSNTFIFNPCFCNILFPYVTTQQGYETGIAISNTSADPFGTATSTGTVTINYFGTNAPTPAAGQSGFTTIGGPNATCPGQGCVPAGGQLVFTVGGGGGSIISPTAGVSPVAQQMPAAANFQGYIIAQSRFKYCHGFAFITCAGCGATAPGASESYLGLIMDGPAGYRTGTTSEVLAH